MPINDILQATIGYSVKGDKLANVIHFQQTSSDGTLAPAKDLAAAIVEDLVPTLKACLSNDCEIVTVSARRVSPTPGGNYINNAGVAGTVAQDVAPAQLTILATLYSETQSKQGRGRIFIPGVPETFLKSSILVNTAADIYVAFLDALMLPVQAGAGATFQAGVWSAGGTFHDYTSHKLRSWAHTLRSRRMANP